LEVALCRIALLYIYNSSKLFATDLQTGLSPPSLDESMAGTRLTSWRSLKAAVLAEVISGMLAFARPTSALMIRATTRILQHPKYNCWVTQAPRLCKLAQGSIADALYRCQYFVAWDIQR